MPSRPSVILLPRELALKRVCARPQGFCYYAGVFQPVPAFSRVAASTCRLITGRAVYVPARLSRLSDRLSCRDDVRITGISRSGRGRANPEGSVPHGCTDRPRSRRGRKLQ